MGGSTEKLLETGVLHADLPNEAVKSPKEPEMGWRRESALDVYTGSFGLFLFVSPWLFAYANEVTRIDIWASGAAITAISIAKILAFSDLEEWFNLLLGLWSMVSPWALGSCTPGRCTSALASAQWLRSSRPLNCGS